MLRPTRSSICTLLVGCLLAIGLWSTTGCRAGYASSASRSLPNGRVVSVESDIGSINIPAPPNEESALIEVGGRKILVAPEQISIDGGKVASIEASAKEIHVMIDGSGVEIRADRAKVYSGNW